MFEYAYCILIGFLFNNLRSGQQTILLFETQKEHSLQCEFFNSPLNAMARALFQRLTCIAFQRESKLLITSFTACTVILISECIHSEYTYMVYMRSAHYSWQRNANWSHKKCNSNIFVFACAHVLGKICRCSFPTKIFGTISRVTCTDVRGEN